MRKLLFTASIMLALLGQLTFVNAQSVSDSDRRQIERELERQISSDTGDSVRVRVQSAQSYSNNNREMNVRGQATVEGRRGNRNDIWYDVIIDTRRNQVTRTNWSYGRNDDRREDRDRYNPPQTGVLRPGRYEIQVVDTKRLLVATNNGQVTELALLRSTGGQLHGTIWLPGEKRTAILVGKTSPAGDFNLFLKKNGGETSDPARLSGKLEESGNSQPADLTTGTASNSLIFRKIEMFEAGCAEWADYVASYDAIFPKTKNETVNAWFSKKAADWMGRCRDFRQAQKTDPMPSIRASQRATGWADVVCWNERLFCGQLHFGGIEDAALSSSEAFNFDLETGREIRPEDLFIGSFDFEHWCEPILKREKNSLSAATTDDFLKKWIDSEPFNLLTIRREGLAFSTRFSPIYGEQTVVVPWAQLRPYLKKDAPVVGFVR